MRRQHSRVLATGSHTVALDGPATRAGSNRDRIPAVRHSQRESTTRSVEWGKYDLVPCDCPSSWGHEPSPVAAINSLYGRKKARSRLAKRLRAKFHLRNKKQHSPPSGTALDPGQASCRPAFPRTVAAACPIAPWQPGIGLLEGLAGGVSRAPATASCGPSAAHAAPVHPLGSNAAGHRVQIFLLLGQRKPPDLPPRRLCASAFFIK